MGLAMELANINDASLGEFANTEFLFDSSSTDAAYVQARPESRSKV